MCGVTGAFTGGEVVVTGGDAVVGLGSGRAGGRTSPPVGSGDSGAPSVGGGTVVVSSVGGVEALLGSSSGEGGEVGGASVARGGPEGEKVGEVVFKAGESRWFVFLSYFQAQYKNNFHLK